MTINSLGRMVVVALALGLASCLDTTSVLNASLSIIGGHGQTGPVNQPLPDSLAVYVERNNGLPFSGIAVNWSVETGGGSVSPSTSTTGPDGIARTSRTLGPTVGEQTTLVQVEGLPNTRFTHTAVP